MRPIDHINKTIDDMCKVVKVTPTELQRDLMKLPLMLLWKEASKAKSHEEK